MLSNEQLLVSIIEQCQFPFTKEKVETAYEIIYHSSIKGLREYYFHEFRKAYKEGLLDKEKFLSLRTRIIHKKNRYASANQSLEFDFHKFENFAKAKEFFEQYNLDAEEIDRIATSQFKQEDNP